MLKKRKKKPKDVQGPSEAMKKYVEILQNDGGSAAGGIPIEKLGPALEAGTEGMPVTAGITLRPETGEDERRARLVQFKRKRPNGPSVRGAPNRLRPR